MPTYTLVGYNIFNADIFGEMSLPTVELINPETGKITTATFNKKFSVNQKSSILFLLNRIEDTFESLSNSKVKSITYSKRYEIDPSGSNRDGLIIEIPEELKLVYDWETRTDVLTKYFQIQNADLGFASLYYSSYKLNSNFNYPAVYATGNRIAIRLNSRETFTTTSEQSFKIVIGLRNGFAGTIALPVVRTV